MAKKFEFGIEDPNGKKKDEISIANNYCARIKEKHGMLFPENQVSNLYRVLFRSMAIILKHFEAKATPKIGFSLLSDNGDFVIGALLTYQAPDNEDEDDQGNWNLSFTFNKEDMKDCDKLIDSHSDSFVAVAGGEIYSAMFGHFGNSTAVSIMFSEAIETIIRFLDLNTNDGEEAEITLPGIFTASCGFEDGAKAYSIVPGAVVKQIVKDDEALSK